MVHSHRQCGEESTAVPLQSQEVEEIWFLTQTFIDAQSRAYCRAVSQPGTETARLSRGWCGLHNASPRANCLPSMTPYSTRCHRKAKKIIKEFNHPSHYLFTPLPPRRQGQYSCIKAGTERLKNSFYLKAIRLLQQSLTQRGCCLTLRPQLLATLINGSLVTLYYAL
jgi:hypothetical protein